MKGRRGSMLVVALWALTMLSVFAMSLGFGVRQRAGLLNRLSTLDALYPIAYSGIERAKALVKADADPMVDALTDAWISPSDATVAAGSFSLKLADEERKLNLNSADAATLSKLIQSVAGLSRESAEEIGYCLVDWMDSDAFFGHPQYGAETSYYESLHFPYAAADKAFQVPEEMLLVKGMTPEVFEKIRPYVTVYGKGQVNVNTAPREVLSALGFSGAGVELLTKYRAGGDGVEGTSDDNFFTVPSAIQTDLATKGGTPLDATQEAVLGSLLASSKLCVASTAFGVTSRATLAKNGSSLEVRAVVDRRGNVLYSRASEASVR